MRLRVGPKVSRVIASASPRALLQEGSRLRIADNPSAHRGGNHLFSAVCRCLGTDVFSGALGSYVLLGVKLALERTARIAPNRERIVMDFQESARPMQVSTGQPAVRSKVQSRFRVRS